LDKANSEPLAEANVQTSTQDHRKASIRVPETRKRSSTEQGMDEGLRHRQAGSKYRPGRERMKIDTVLVGPAEIRRDA
jgi:hypothetical protein